MISENKLSQERVEDELSTSAGSSDNEVGGISDDEAKFSTASVKNDPNVIWASDGPRNIIIKVMLTIVNLLKFFSSFLLGVTKQQMENRSACFSYTANKRPATMHRRPLPARKVPKSQQSRWHATKPIQRKPFHGQTSQHVPFPPGLEDVSYRNHLLDKFAPPQQNDSSNKSLRLDEIGLPPGLEDFVTSSKQSLRLDEIGLPPGLEDFVTRQAQGLQQHKHVCIAPVVQQQPQQHQAPQLSKAGPRNRQQVPIGACPVPTQSKRSQRARKDKATAQLGKPSPPPPELPASPVVQVAEPPPPRSFEQTAYRKELSGALHDLANGSNVAVAIRRIRAHNVPKEQQAAEFCDILTRAAEDERGLARRLALAFAIGLAVGSPISVFDREECIAGLQLFFADVVDDLAMEVPRLRNRLSNELAPLLLTILSEEELARYVPVECRTPCN